MFPPERGWEIKRYVEARNVPLSPRTDYSPDGAKPKEKPRHEIGRFYEQGQTSVNAL